MAIRSEVTARASARALMTAAPSRRCNRAHYRARPWPSSTTSAPIHLRPATELAERVLLPGDPHRALAVAQDLLETPPKMFNHARGLWGYTGIAPDGEPLTVQSTGMGGPSAAIVCEELIALGATPAGPDRHLRRARSGARARGSAGRRGGAPGRRRQRGARRRRSAGARPRAARAAGGGRRTPGDGRDQRPLLRPARRGGGDWIERGASAVEMEAATILQMAALRGVAAACVLGVSDVPSSTARAGWVRTS